MWPLRRGMIAGRGALDAAAAGGGDAAETTAFLARVAALPYTLDATHLALYKTLINGMVTDGTFAKMRAVYIHATETTAIGKMNLVSTSHTIVQSGSVTFTADQGYTPAGGYLDTNCALNAGSPFLQNSSSLGAYILNNRTTDANYVNIGVTDGTSYWYQQTLINSGGLKFFFDLGATSFPSVANTTTQGAWISSRTGDTTNGGLYKNGSSTPLVATGGGSTTAMSSSQNVYVGALNSNGTATNQSGDQIAASFIGGGLTGAEAVLVNNRINAYMAGLSVPANVY